jgi:shikimate dehydrogenase
MTKRYAVIGDPVSHSLSPVMHEGWIADHGLDASYEAYLLRSDNPVAAIRALRGYAGANVTVPHKEAAASAADRNEGDVANVLRWESDGSISAFNSDGAGFLDALTEAVPDWQSQAKTALVLGAGGAAQAIAGALAGSSRLIIANRTFARAAELAEHLTRANAAAWESLPQCFADADLIVNATTLGMGGGDQQWPLDACQKETMVVDIVYRPLETALLKGARGRGLVALDGLGMLIHQGARSFEIWHGIKPDTAKARARLLEALA